MAKSPAFQFYPKDFLADGEVSVMNLEETGAYIILLSYCWIEGSIPDDMAKLASLCRVSNTKMKRIWEVVKKCFKKRRGKYVNERLILEKSKQKAYSASRRNNAKSNKTKGVIKKAHAKHMLSIPNALQFAVCSLHTAVSKGRTTPDLWITFEESDKVKMTQNQTIDLVDQFGEPNVRTYIIKMQHQIVSKGKRYDSHYHTILSWMTDDKVQKTDKPKSRCWVCDELIDRDQQHDHQTICLKKQQDQVESVN